MVSLFIQLARIFTSKNVHMIIPYRTKANNLTWDKERQILTELTLTLALSWCHAGSSEQVTNELNNVIKIDYDEKTK